MQTFTGYEYLLIDAANQYGLDKLTFDERLNWANNAINNFEVCGDNKGEWKEKPLYIKAVQAVRKAQRGEATGHLVGFDAICSGMQIMSAVTGCEAGGRATGLIDTGLRPNAYSECTELMRKRVPSLDDSCSKKVKLAVMTSLYGSKEEPKNLFGHETPELNAFYESIYELAPGACDLLEDLRNSWKPYELSHEWKLPDGFDARIKVLQKVEKRIEVDELDHATFTYEYKDNVGTAKSVANVANVVHSIDAYILRCLERRCNYNPFVLGRAYTLLVNEGLRRGLGGGKRTAIGLVDDTKFDYYVEQFKRSGVADVVILPHLNKTNVYKLTEVHLDKLYNLVIEMITYKPFELVTIHDEFKCHPNNMNYLRMQYRNILADLADSHILDDLLSQLYGVKGHFNKKSKNLGDKIRKSNYTLT